MKARLLYLLLPVLLIVSCSRHEDNLPATPSDEVNYVQKIDSVNVIHFSADTIHVPLSDLTGSFSKPVHVVHIENTLPEKLKDTVYLDLTTNPKIAFNKAVFLPVFIVGKKENKSAFLPSFAVDVRSYQTKTVFNSRLDLPPSSYTYNAPDRDISGYTLERGYDRIFFTADVELEGTDSKGNEIRLSGILKGSKAGRKYYAFHPY